MSASVDDSGASNAERRLRTEPLVWRALEPAGFSLEPRINGWQGLLTATVCARGHMYYESCTHFYSLHRFSVSELVLSEDYELVGKTPYTKSGSGSDQYIRYYTRKDVNALNAYSWAASGRDTSVHIKTWRDRLASYCSGSFE